MALPGVSFDQQRMDDLKLDGNEMCRNIDTSEATARQLEMNLRMVKNAQSKAKRAIDYWKTRDVSAYGDWIVVLAKCNGLLQHHVSVSNEKDSSDNVVRRPVDTNQSARIEEIVSSGQQEDNHSTLIEKKDGAMDTIDNIMSPGVAARKDRVIKFRKSPEDKVRKQSSPFLKI